MFRNLLLVLAVLPFGSLAAAQEPVAVGERTWRLPSADPEGTNAVLFGGSEQALLIDPGRTPAEVRARLIQAAQLCEAPVKTVVLTSADSGLGVLLAGEADFEILCHANARRTLAENGAAMLAELRASAKSEEEAALFDPRRFRLPDRSISGVERLHLGEHHIRIVHLEGARTTGDVVAFSHSDSVFAAGELAFHGEYPRLHSSSDLAGWKRALGAMADSSSNRVIGARGEAFAATNLMESRDVLSSTERLQPMPEFAVDWKHKERWDPLIVEDILTDSFAYPQREFAGLLKAFQEVEVIAEVESANSASWQVGLSSHGLRGAIDGEHLVLAERDAGAEVARLKLGPKPLEPKLSADGRLLYVPLRGEGRIRCLDLFNLLPQDDALVGGGVGEGAFLKHDTDFVLPVASKSSLVFVNTASREISMLLNDGIGRTPAGIAINPARTLGLVWYTAEAKLTAVDLTHRKALGDLRLEEAAGRVRFAPSGEHVLVWGKDSGTITRHGASYSPRVLEGNSGSGKAEVAVMGMTHSGHVDSELWGLDEVAETIRNFQPEVVLVEIPPDRWEKAWEDFAVHGVVEESRVRVFPEYRGMMFDLAVELGFTIEPCAAWTKEMNDLRREKLRQFRENEEWAEARAALNAESAEVEARWKDSPVHGDDPHVIHSDEYDRFVEDVMDPIGRYQNEMVGLGGWYNINRAHMALVHEAIERHPGKRILITFGAYHKYMFLKELREREDIELVELGPYLPKR